MAGGNNNTTNATRGVTTGHVGGRGPTPVTNQESVTESIQTTGPLSSLYTNKYIPTNLKYPSDLDSDTRGHIIQFSINDTQPSTYKEDNPKSSVSDGQVKTAKSDLYFQPERTRISQTISLYIPDTLASNYNASYTDVSELDAIGSIAGVIGSIAGKSSSRLGKMAAGISSAVQSAAGAADNPAVKLAASAAGKAINPRKQLLFDGIDFRSFQFAFTFSPTSQQESDIVNTIIQTFKYHAAPRIQSGPSSFLFIPPSSFTIEFLYKSTTNTYINRIAESVLESIDVNYAPNGIWSAFDQTGAPTQVTLSLSFKEI